MEYGYGHTKESAKIVRDTLKNTLSFEIKAHELKISVKTPGRGHHYGGPRVEITTPQIKFDKQYQYIVNSSDGNIGDGPGKLVTRPVSDFVNGRPHYTAQLVTPDALEAINAKINKVLSAFGRDNDDAMTDYFDNTAPLFYGVQYKAN